MQRHDNECLRVRPFCELFSMPQIVINGTYHHLIDGQRKPVQQGLKSFSAQHGQYTITHGNDVGSTGLAQNQARLAKTHPGTDFVVKHQLAVGRPPRDPQAATDEKKHLIGGLTFADYMMAAMDLL